MKDWPFKTHPTGWYMLEWGWELASGEVRPMKVFDQDIVLYRTEDGVANVLDAYCPHLGAHLGYGGKVLGECLKCPWHGWQWSVDGRNTHIPFIDRINERVTIKTWDVREIDEIIIVWYDALGRPPHWEFPGVPEFRDRTNFYDPRLGTHRYGVLPIMPQSPVENNADQLHFPHVHGADGPAECIRWEEDGPILHCHQRIHFGGGHESTWLTPNGPTFGVIEGVMYGISMGVAKFVIDGLVVPQFVCITPVDMETSMIFSTTTTNIDPASPDKPAGRAKMMMKAQIAQLANDFEIWSHQRYVERPPFVGSEEREYARLRRWSRQFYPDARPLEAMDDVLGEPALRREG